jgi:hypothetical protein
MSALGHSGVNRRMVVSGLVAAGVVVATLLARRWQMAPDRVSMDQAAFDAAIEGWAQSDTPSSDGRWHDPTAIALSGMGGTSVEYAIAFLGCGCRSPAEEGSVVKAMYLLPLPDYLVFLNRLIGLYDRHGVATDALALAVQVPDAFSTELQRHYRDSDVRAVLGEVASRPGLPQDTKDGIDDLLSGRTWSMTRTYCRSRLLETVSDCRTLGVLDLF